MERGRSSTFSAGIEAESWVGRKADARDTKFLHPASRRVWERAVGDPMIADRLSCSILEVGGVPAAFTFSLRCGDTLYFIANSYSERFAEGSPGRILLYRDFQRAAEDGVVKVGWGAGDPGYKSEMGAEPGPDIVDLLLVRGPMCRAGAALVEDKADDRHPRQTGTREHGFMARRLCKGGGSSPCCCWPSSARSFSPPISRSGSACRWCARSRRGSIRPLSPRALFSLVIACLLVAALAGARARPCPLDVESSRAAGAGRRLRLACCWVSQAPACSWQARPDFMLSPRRTGRSNGFRPCSSSALRPCSHWRPSGAVATWSGFCCAVLLCLALFVIGMEEISWGQRLFGFATPERLAEVNWQAEFNFHNVQTDLSETAYYFGAGVFLILLPLLRDLLPGLSRLASLAQLAWVYSEATRRGCCCRSPTTRSFPGMLLACSLPCIDLESASASSVFGPGQSR